MWTRCKLDPLTKVAESKQRKQRGSTGVTYNQVITLMQYLEIFEYLEHLTYLDPLQGLDPLTMVGPVDKGWTR